MSYIFETDRLGFRQWKASDLEPFAAINDDDRVMEFFPAKPSKADTARFIETTTEHFAAHGFGWYAVDLLETGELIGFIGLKNFDFQNDIGSGVEIGWRLATAYWGKGLATEGAKACLDYAWQELNLSEVYSFTPVLNKRSARVMQKLGMSFLQEFNHPKVEKGHVLERHVLYRIQRP